MSALHTPGQLEAHGRTLYAGKAIVVLAVSEYDAERAPTYNTVDGLKTDDEAYANALRIVHCWNCHDELVASLNDCLGFWDKPRPTFGANEQRKLELEAIQAKARAALAKAKGGAR